MAKFQIPDSKFQSGFTLLEFLIVFAIVLMLAAGGALIYTRFYTSSQINEATTQMIQTIRIARERARAGLNDVNHGIYFDTTNKKYTLYQGNSWTDAGKVIIRDTALDSVLSLSTSLTGNDLNFSKGLGIPNISTVEVITLIGVASISTNDIKFPKLIAFANAGSGTNVITIHPSGAVSEGAPPPPPDFTIVVLPDTQGYSESFPAVFDAQTNWIVANKNTLNIKFVLHNGDLVEHQTGPLSATEWGRASISMGILDNQVPYSVSTANHDLDDGTQSCPTAVGNGTTFRSYFPVSRFTWSPTWGGYFDPPNVNRNSMYHTFSVGYLDFIVIALEWEAPDDVLTWATNLLNTTYSNHRAIITTHHYLEPGPPPFRNTTWPWPRCTPNYGEDMWQEFVKLYQNIFMVHSAHIFGEGRQTSINNAGKSVYEIVTNYHPNLPNGGDGWLRYYTFKPSLNEIHAFTYTPYLTPRFDTDPDSQFILPYNMTN